MSWIDVVSAVLLALVVVAVLGLGAYGVFDVLRDGWDEDLDSIEDFARCRRALDPRRFGLDRHPAAYRPR